MITLIYFKYAVKHRYKKHFGIGALVAYIGRVAYIYRFCQLVGILHPVHHESNQKSLRFDSCS